MHNFPRFCGNRVLSESLHGIQTPDEIQNQFKKVLKSKGYNTRPNFWNTEINRGRNLDKEKVNLFNKEHKLPLITGVNINTSNLV